jgi:hypothetical protein
MHIGSEADSGLSAIFASVLRTSVPESLINRHLYGGDEQAV